MKKLRKWPRWVRLHFSISQFRSFPSGGFTMVEVVIILAIIVIISSILLANFSGISQTIGIQRSVQHLALDLRRAQSMALSVREINVCAPPNTLPPYCPGAGTPPGLTTPYSYGVHIDTGSSQTTYLIFADLAGLSGTPDGIYDPNDDYLVETETVFGAGNFLVAPTTEDSTQRPILNITFSVPSGNTSLADDSQILENTIATIEIAGQFGQFKKKVRVFTTGLISIRE